MFISLVLGRNLFSFYRFTVLLLSFFILFLHVGGTCEAWFGGEKDSSQVVDINSSRVKDRGRFVADLFGSVCCTFQHGKFTKTFGDLTRLDARVDISSASALANSVVNLCRRAQNHRSPNLQSSPRLSLIFQQQVTVSI